MSGFADYRVISGHVDLLPGTGDDLRRGADALEATAEPLAAAVVAADRIQAVFSGRDWRGEAWTSFIAAARYEYTRDIVTNAVAVVGEAAHALRTLAEAHDRHQEGLRSCRRRLEAEVAAIAEGGDPIRGLDVLAEADAIHRAHQECEASLWALFDRLDDATMLAEAPASFGEQIRTTTGFVWDQAWEVGAGAVEATVELVTVAALLSTPLAPYFIYRHLDDHGADYVAAVQYAIDDPAGFAVELGKAVIDTETLSENPARWFGRLLPDLALTVATAGAGGLVRGTRAGAKGLDAATTVGKSARALDRVADGADLAVEAQRSGRAVTAMAEATVAASAVEPPWLAGYRAASRAKTAKHRADAVTEVGDRRSDDPD